MSAGERSTGLSGGAVRLIFIQVASRALTFIGNQFLLRFLSPSLLGIAVQLELVSVTSLYFARESLRVALQRQPPAPTETADSSSKGGKGDNLAQTVINLSYLGVFLGLITSGLFGYSYLEGAQAEVRESPYFLVSFQIYAAATLIELLAEPAFIIIQQKTLYRERARAETTGAIARCFFACLTAMVGHRQGVNPSILPFAVGQAAYAIVLLVLYLLPATQASRADHFSLAPTWISSSKQHYTLSLFHSSILSLAVTLYLQSIFKLLLTQGDVLILTLLSSLSEQGAFALASNYGGLLARLVFQPVEESSRTAFGRLLASTTDADATSSKSASSSSASSISSNHPSKANLDSALAYLATITRVYLVFSLPLVALVPSALPIVIPILLPAKFTSASTLTLLSTYIYLLPLTALNGILDAFVTSVATPAQLGRQSLWMAAFTAAYGAAAFMLLRTADLGAAGLVGANMINMGMRVVWSVWFIRAWIARNDPQDGAQTQKKVVGDALPGWASVGVAASVALGLQVSQGLVPGVGSTKDVWDQLGYLVAGTAVLGSTMLISERDFLLQMLESMVPRQYLDRIPFLPANPSQ